MFGRQADDADAKALARDQRRRDQPFGFGAEKTDHARCAMRKHPQDMAQHGGRDPDPAFGGQKNLGRIPDGKARARDVHLQRGQTGHGQDGLQSASHPAGSDPGDPCGVTEGVASGKVARAQDAAEGLRADERNFGLPEKRRRALLQSCIRPGAIPRKGWAGALRAIPGAGAVPKRENVR